MSKMLEVHGISKYLLQWHDTALKLHPPSPKAFRHSHRHFSKNLHYISNQKALDPSQTDAPFSFFRSQIQAFSPPRISPLAFPKLRYHNQIANPTYKQAVLLLPFWISDTCTKLHDANTAAVEPIESHHQFLSPRPRKPKKVNMLFLAKRSTIPNNLFPHYWKKFPPAAR